MLYGVAPPIRRALVQLGYRVREYCPIGELVPGMAYLVRRLLENTSYEGFLRASFNANKTITQFLNDPVLQVSDRPPITPRSDDSADGKLAAKAQASPAQKS